MKRIWRILTSRDAHVMRKPSWLIDVLIVVTTLAFVATG